MYENSHMEDPCPSPRSSEVLEDQISDTSSDRMDIEVGDIVLGTESESDACDSEGVSEADCEAARVPLVTHTIHSIPVLCMVCVNSA